jgi:hypothetical protein
LGTLPEETAHTTPLATHADFQGNVMKDIRAFSALAASIWNTFNDGDDGGWNVIGNYTGSTEVHAIIENCTKSKYNNFTTVIKEFETVLNMLLKKRREYDTQYYKKQNKTK